LYAKINWEGKTIELRSPLTNIKVLCSNLFRLGFDVIDINSYEDPIEAETVQKLLSSSSEEIITEHNVQKTQIQKKKNIEKQIYSDAGLSKAKEAIDWLISKVPAITQRVDRSLSFGELKQLRDLEENLKKLKMGNNYEKIKEAGNKLFQLIETLNERYYAGVVSKATLPIFGSVVTDIDIYKQLDALDFARQSRKI
jgi:CHAT domain-containing protein